MGRLLIVNGSPRAPCSNSRRYIEYFLQNWKGAADQYAAVSGGPVSFELYTDLLLVFPLYVDGVPAVLLPFLKTRGMGRHTPSPRSCIGELRLFRAGAESGGSEDGAVFLQEIRLSLGDDAADRLWRGDSGHTFRLVCAPGYPASSRRDAEWAKQGGFCADAAEQGTVCTGLHALLERLRGKKSYDCRTDADHGD